MAGRRGAGDWAAEGAGAWVHCSREGAGGGPGGIARVPGGGWESPDERRGNSASLSPSAAGAGARS